MHIGNENFFVHHHFKGGNNLNGNDIALIGIYNEHYHRMDEFNNYY